MSQQLQQDSLAANKRILILYTGGTIGMDYIDGTLRVISGLFKSQLHMLKPVAQADLTLIEYDDIIDSSDITISHWQKIIQDIASNYYDYDGFVIVHGTDTMAYTASVLAFALRGLHKPVILTGAQLPLVHRRSDGWSNLIEAIYAAMRSDLHEVAIAFNHKLFRACRAQKVSTNSFLGFDTIDKLYLAEFGMDIKWHKNLWLKANSFSFSPIIPKQRKILDLTLKPGFTTDFITSVLNKTNANAVILQTYGAGTIPMNHHKLIAAITNCISRGVIIVGITQVIDGRVSGEYGNSRLSPLGIISGGDMTPEATLAKLTILLSTKMTKECIKATMASNLVGELVA